MGKVGYSYIYVITIIALVTLLIQMGNRREKRQGIVVPTILIVVMNALFMGSLFTSDRQILVSLYSLIQILEIWTLIQIFVLLSNYLKIKFRYVKVISIVAGIFAVIDSVFFIVNFLSGKLILFGLMEKKGQVYLTVQPNFFFGYHILLSFIVAIGITALMVVKAYMVPHPYQRKYIFWSIFLALGILSCSAIRYIGDYFAFPTVFFMTIGIFFAHYKPRSVTNQLNHFIVENFGCPVLLFNYDDELQVYNKQAVDLLNVSDMMPLSDFIRRSNLKYILTPERRRTGKTREFSVTESVGSISFFIHGQEIWSEKGSFIGTLLTYQDISGQEKLKDEATYHATRDKLTGLWNRDYFFEMVKQTLNENPDKAFIMIAADMYQFKLFNDILGVAAGNDLLITIARSFKECCRANWVLGRISGDRFAMLMPKDDFNEKSMMKYFHAVLAKRGYSLRVHYYLGVYEITDRYLSADAMYDRAYMAVESIKGSLQTEVAYYSEELRKKRVDDTLTLEELDQAIELKQLEIFLQPQIDSRTSKVIGAEALVRWNHPQRGIIGPNEFIPLFETRGMITKLDYVVWELACKKLRDWKDRGNVYPSISVNISAKDFYLTDLYADLVGLVEKYELSPMDLKLEITETAFVLDVQKQMDLIEKLRDYGFIIEIDDFGCGYSSLNSLKDIHVDVIKLDMKFFEKTNHVKRAEKIVESVIKLAYNLKVPVIAEGVETKEQVDRLMDMGCHLIQGYYYSKPLNVSEYETFAQERESEDIREIINKLKS